MTQNSRFQLDPATGLPEMRDFKDLGHALRSMASDEEAIRVSDGMGELSFAIERVGKALSEHKPGATVGPLLVDLLTTLRRHRQLVVGLSAPWRELYEYAGYLNALNNFRVLVGMWLVERNISGDKSVVIDEFEMIGWRTLGEGLMMIDMHQQAQDQVQAKAQAESGIAPLDDSKFMRAKQWWGQLRS
jgi:hypothetical protein